MSWNGIFFTNSCSWLKWNKSGEPTAVGGRWNIAEINHPNVQNAPKVHLVSAGFQYSIPQSMHLCRGFASQGSGVSTRFCPLFGHFLTALELFYLPAAQSKKNSYLFTSLAVDLSYIHISHLCAVGVCGNPHMERVKKEGWFKPEITSCPNWALLQLMSD